MSEPSHDEFGAVIAQSELHPVTFTDPDVLDQPQHTYVPGDRLRYIGDAEHRDYPRPRR